MPENIPEEFRGEIPKDVPKGISKEKIYHGGILDKEFWRGIPGESSTKNRGRTNGGIPS